MDCKFMRAYCWECVFIHYATALLFFSLLRLGFSTFTFLFSCPSHQTENQHSVTFKHTSPNLFTSKIPKLDNKLKVKFNQKPTEFESSRCENWKSQFVISSGTGFLPTHVPFPFTSSSLRTSISSPAPASVRFLSLVELNKSQHCKIHMVVQWECRYEKVVGVVTFYIFLFFVFFSEKHESAGCCWVVAAVSIFFLNPLFCTKSNSKDELHVKWQWWYERSSSSWDVALLLY